MADVAISIGGNECDARATPVAGVMGYGNLHGIDMSTTIPIQQRFERALDALIAKAREDPYILAVVLFGSLSHDRVWEKSDIDLMLVGRDDSGGKKGEARSFALLEEGVNIHAFLQPRGQFKKMIEGALQSSFMHSSFAK